MDDYTPTLKSIEELAELATGGNDKALFRRAQLVGGENAAGGTLDAIAAAVDDVLTARDLPKVKRASLGNALLAWNLASETLSDWASEDGGSDRKHAGSKRVATTVRLPRVNGDRHVALVADLVRTVGTSRLERANLRAAVREAADMADKGDAIAHLIGSPEEGDHGVLRVLRVDAATARKAGLSADKSGDGTGVAKRVSQPEPVEREVFEEVALPGDPVAALDTFLKSLYATEGTWTDEQRADIAATLAMYVDNMAEAA